MAQILPAGNQLPAIQEQIETSVTFTALLETGETLKSINIIDYRSNVGIVVSGATYSGNYRDSFSIGSGSLKVRNRKSGLIESYDSWESLPPPQDADLFEWNAPSVLSTDYFYTVKMVYEYAPAVVPGEPPIKPVEKELIKTYTQTVHGNWNVWAIRLRNYVQASGPLPR